MKLSKYHLPILLFVAISLLALTLLNRLFPFYNQNIYYASLFTILAYQLIVSPLKSINWFSVILLILTFLSVLLNEIPQIFKAEQRWMGWVLVLLTLGPALSHKRFFIFRHKSFNWIMLLCALMGVASFLAFAAGMPSLGRGNYSGFTYHSMMLGPLAALGSIVLLTTSLERKKWYYWLFLLFAIFSMLLASSRMAIIAMGTTSLLLLFLKYRKGVFLILFIIPVLFITLLPLFTTLSLEQKLRLLTEGLEQKGDYNSREDLWTDRLNEFKARPWVGVGFASYDTKISTSKFDKETGTVEPGSSWLAILSMTGLLGLLSFVLLWANALIPVVNHVLKKERHTHYLLVIGVNVFFILHFIAEGYVFASGSALAMVFWLSLGHTYDVSNYLKFTKNEALLLAKQH